MDKNKNHFLLGWSIYFFNLKFPLSLCILGNCRGDIEKRGGIVVSFPSVCPPSSSRYLVYATSPSI